MLMLGFGGFGFATFLVGMKVGQIVEAAWWKGKLQEARAAPAESRVAASPAAFMRPSRIACVRAIFPRPADRLRLFPSRSLRKLPGRLKILHRY